MSDSHDDVVRALEQLAATVGEAVGRPRAEAIAELNELDRMLAARDEGIRRAIRHNRRTRRAAAAAARTNRPLTLRGELDRVGAARLGINATASASSLIDVNFVPAPKEANRVR